MAPPARQKSTLPPFSAAAGRRFLLERFGLTTPQAFQTVAEVVQRLEYVQMDSIHVCGRIHDLILWSRVQDYSPEKLNVYLYQERAGFEYYLPNLCILPREDLPLFRETMHRWATAQQGYYALSSDQERTVAQALLSLIRSKGALHPKQVDAALATQGGRTINGWGSESRMTTHLLEKLYAQGLLGIAFRTRFDRHYDLLERLYPLGERLSPAEASRQKALKRARAWRIFKTSKLLKEGLPAEAVCPVQIEGLGKGYHILQEDLPFLEAAETSVPAPSESGPVQLLAPLEPLIYDRERTRALFQFDYTWEVYVPASKRKWGYYVLPILQGERLIGRVDGKLDRKSGTLVLQSVALEPGVNPEAVAQPLGERLRRWRDFLGARTLKLVRSEPEALSELLSLTD